jgi:hypothetical protein
MDLKTRISSLKWSLHPLKVKEQEYKEKNCGRIIEEKNNK